MFGHTAHDGGRKKPSKMIFGFFIVPFSSIGCTNLGRLGDTAAAQLTLLGILFLLDKLYFMSEEYKGVFARQMLYFDQQMPF
jgi:hypothetical protein